MIRTGKFADWRPQFYSLGQANCTLEIVGMGALGKAIAQRLVGEDWYRSDRHTKTYLTGDRNISVSCLCLAKRLRTITFKCFITLF